MNRGLATQPVTPGRLHWERYDIDWYPTEPGQPTGMMSWSVRKCWCKEPWRHY